MKKLVRIAAMAFIMFCCVHVANSQNSTNNGTEFWTAYMDHNNGASTDGNGYQP